MGLLTEWISHIITFILLAVVIELILPNGSFQKYVKMVVGLLFIFILFSPLFRLFHGDVDTWLASIQQQPNETFENDIEKKKKEIQASQRAYILEQMAVQLKNIAAEELMRTYGLIVTDISFTIGESEQNPPPIESITVELAEEAASVVKPIRIQSTTPPTDRHDDIARFLANMWEVDPQMITVHLERRE
ncbi:MULTISPECIES: stage III sporulation protein AF [Anoxybacillus]|uniref:Stage III sporulation protein AF n=2 Tax=Anoxybacillus TaxID=150247 RepID=A0A1I0SQR3_9BACL|nr:MULTISPECIES: stage III sporulation protein AF [Anoxybacillus]EMT47198.1 stage III sporulation protein AF [Anoxybacillus flavithermus AK1]MBW7649744.1 stage III sporulation protein AF [Anoxybacillus sp. ST4]NNU97455.1 stage III sporulation protein AF [Anoxybacillus sp. EFIL]SFA41864.1 stage III sporulation protein AF [Anoxybacillus pushchinoensis]